MSCTETVDVEMTTAVDEEMHVAEPADSGLGSGSCATSTSTSEAEEGSVYDTAIPVNNENIAPEAAAAASMIDDTLKTTDLGLVIDLGNTAFTIKSDKSATVREILQQVADTQGISSDGYDLAIGARILSQSDTLGGASVTHGSRLTLVERPFQLFIRDVNGRNHTLNVRSSTTVLDLKKDFSEVSMVPVNDQHLHFESKELQNGHNLKRYNIHKDSQLQVMHRLVGGQAACTIIV